MTEMKVKPWDARAAYFLVRPFKDSWVTPNHFTTLRLMAGLGSGAVFASGHWPNLGAGLFVNLIGMTALPAEQYRFRSVVL
jgi:hypothetical protein